MKKLILPVILLLFLFLPVAVFAQDSSQEKNITCEEAKKILSSADCPFWAKKLLNVWCYQEEFKGTTAEEAMAYTDTIMSQPANYTLDSDACFEGLGIDQEESERQDTAQTTEPAEQIPLSKGPALVSIGYKWIESLYLNKLANLIKEFEVIEIEAQKSPEFIKRELSERKAELSEEMVDKYKNTPYQIDILHGQAQIKLPGQNNWSDLKQGDKIPPGSTVFTGMDTTTVLTIENKGVVQIAPFSEVIINESGLEQATLNKELFNDIEIDKGEIEVNIESGVYTAPILNVHTPSGTVGVRGTHFWVSYNNDKKITTVGVYKGEVEVKVKGSNQSTLVSPDGDKPGVVVVTQKFSLNKLALAGLVLVVVIGGAILVLKRKFSSKGFVKKKR